MNRRQFNCVPIPFLAAVMLLAQHQAHALSIDGLTNKEVTQGLKTALETGAIAAASMLGQPDGFLANPKVRIPLPGFLEDASKLLRVLGQGARIDELVTAMNRAAEAAVPMAKDLLVGAVRSMSVSDAKKILSGGETSVTAFFAERTRAPLRVRFLPEVSKATAKVGLPPEIGSIRELAYRPVNEVEQMTMGFIKRVGKASRNDHARNLKGAVESNTAARRLDQIAAFLTWYFENVLDYRIRSASKKAELMRRYESTTADLKGAIRGGKKGHSNEIRSLPKEVYLKIIREIFLRPELIQSASGATSSTMMRDRAVALLACEGLRPGAIGNLTLNNFRWRVGDVAGGYMDLRDNVAKRKTRTTTKTLVQKGSYWRYCLNRRFSTRWSHWTHAFHCSH